MPGGRFKEAMSDLAETIRRVFQAPASHSVPTRLVPRATGRVKPLEVPVGAAFIPCTAVPVREPLLSGGAPAAATLGWSPVVRGESGLAGWAAGVNACAMPLFHTERCARLVVPPLPRQAGTRWLPVAAPTVRARTGWNAMERPGVRSGLEAMGEVRAYPGMRAMLGLPMAVSGQDLKRIPKALWMRYTLQLVRTTGENIRNLEVVGLYRIPVKGTVQVRQEPASDRLLVHLGPEALDAKRALFMLARRKTDASMVCCFVEETA